MAKFVLDTNGVVIRADLTGNRWSDLDSFTQGFLEAAFFTECSPAFDSEDWESEECKEAQDAGQADGTLPGDAGFSDLDPQSLAAAVRYCANWQKANAELLDEAYARNGYDASRAGNDLWFTHNGHGVGYWDRKELEPDSDEYKRLTDAIIAARGDNALWSRLIGESARLKESGLGKRLSGAAGRGEIYTFFQDGRVYLEGFPTC